MFVIVENNFVIWGPKTWNKLSFEDVLRTDCEIEYTLETRNNENLPVIINENVKILPVVAIDPPTFNGKTQRLDGPFWNFSDTKAEMYWGVADLEVEAVKNMLKGAIAYNRYNHETKGLKLTVQGNEVTIDTARGSRDVFLQSHLVLGESETVSWKFPETFLTVSKGDLEQITAAIKNHVQSCFTWEQNKNIEIDNAATLEDLDAIILEVTE